MPAYDRDLFNPPAPVALVSIQNPVTGDTLHDVPMLIDSGADITLVAEISVLRLNISLNESDGYELEGFGGHRSIARAARMRLHLSRFTFSGQFLAIQQPYGILGRNLLNQMRFLS